MLVSTSFGSFYSFVVELHSCLGNFQLIYWVKFTYKLVNFNPFLSWFDLKKTEWKQLRNTMLSDANRVFFLLFQQTSIWIFSATDLTANLNILVWCLLSDCHCLRATIPWSRSMILMFSNVTKLFNSLSKRQDSTNLLLDLARKRFCMAWRLHFSMFYWFFNNSFYLSIFMSILSRKITTQAETS